jgi:hypothetical protein
MVKGGLPCAQEKPKAEITFEGKGRPVELLIDMIGICFLQ